MKLTRMGHVALHVADVSRALAFYKDVLGLDSRWEGQPDWANVRLGSDDLSLVRQEGHRHPPHVGFRVASRAELIVAREEVLRAGAKAEDIHDHRDGTASFYFRDPDDNVLELLWDPSDTESKWEGESSHGATRSD